MELPNNESIRWLLRRYAALLARDGRLEAGRKLVLPTAEFFPDPFDGDQGSVNVLFWRLQEHASMTDVDIELRFVDDIEASGDCACETARSTAAGRGDAKGNRAAKAKNCGGDTCGCDHGTPREPSLPNVELLADNTYCVDVRRSDARSAVALTSSMATSLAHVHVLRSGGFEPWVESEWMATSELAAVTLGFGVLLTNASYVYSKACHGVRVDRATSLDVTELALALAVSTTLGSHSHSRVCGHLDVTQRDAYAESRLWVDSNPRLLRRLARDPGSVAVDESLAIEPARTWLARLLGLGARHKKAGIDLRDDDDLSALASSLAARRAQSTKPKANDPRVSELRALVEESLQGIEKS